MDESSSDKFDEVSIYLAASATEAHILKSKLLAEGIECRVENDGLAGVQGEVPFGVTTSPQLWVTRKDAEAAKKLLTATDADSEYADEEIDDLPETDQAETDQAETDQAETDQAETDQAETDQAEPNEPSEVSRQSGFRREWIVIAVIGAIFTFTVWAIVQSERENTAAGFRWEGYHAFERGELRTALKEYSKAIEAMPSDGSLYSNRAYIHVQLHQYSEAVQDYSRAIELSPDSALTDLLYNRGFYNHECGRFEHARQDYEAALKRSPGDMEVRNAIAWLLATCPNDSIRDGPAALEQARKCCEETEEPPWYWLGTKAAAHAECGEFEAAVKLQSRVVGLAPLHEKESSRELLTLYQENKPARYDGASKAE